MNIGRRGLKIAVIAALASGIAVLLWFMHQDAPVRRPAVQELPSPPLASRDSSEPTRPPLTAAGEAPLTVIDTRYEICSNSQLNKTLAQPSEFLNEVRSYVEKQSGELRDAAIKKLLSPQADDGQRVAGLMIKDELEAVAQVAAATNDGKAYGMAWRACRTRGAAAPAACSALSLERWAQLEPDNAMPWLEILSEAQRRADRAQAVTAVHRAALASRLDSGGGWLLNEVRAALPADLPEGGELLLLVDLVGRQAALAVEHRSGVMRYCSAEALLDANTRQQCEQVAQVMMRRSRTAFDMMNGVTIGERLGLPEDRMPTTRQRIDAAMRWAGNESVALNTRPACEGSRAMITLIRDAAGLGEVQAAEAAIKTQP